MDWGLFIFSPSEGRIEKLRRLADNRFHFDSGLAEEAFTFGLEKISAANWKRLGDFSGKASPEAYLAVVFSNILEDFSRAKFGRPRPPAWLKSLGGVWLEIHQLLCVERNADEEVLQKLVAKDRDELFVGQAIQQIRAKLPNCGSHQYQEVEWEEHEHQIGSDNDDPVNHIEYEGREQRLKFASDILELVGEDGAISDIELASIELEIIRLVYLDGLSVSKAARFLSIPAHTARRTLKSTLQKLRRRIDD